MSVRISILMGQKLKSESGIAPFKSRINYLYEHTIMIVFVFCLLALALSIDYSLSLITAQAYWMSLGGSQKLAGLAFGIYDASTFIFAPVLAVYISRGHSYKRMFAIGLLINIVGNAVYALAYLANDPIMILAGRAISGLGAACLPFVMVYLADYFDEKDQTRAVGYVKYTAATSRMLGPLIGSLFTIMVSPETTAGKLFNMYTMAGWIPILVDLVALFFLWRFFPSNVAENYKSLNSDVKSKTPDSSLISTESSLGNPMVGWSVCGLIFHSFWAVVLIGFLNTLMYWMFMGNAFLLATHFYHVIHNQHDLYRIYVTGFVGFTCSFLIFYFGKRKLSKFGVLTFTTLLLLSSCFIFISKPDAMFYVGVGVTTFAYGLMIPYLNVLNNGIGKKIKKKVGSHMVYGIFMLTVFQSAARFAGPAIFAIFTEVDESHDCDFEDRRDYQTSGCEIRNYKAQSIGYLSTSLVLAIIGLLALHYRMRRLRM